MAKIFGTTGDDTLATAAAGDQVYGLAGNDELSSTLSATSLFGAAGNDTITAAIDSTDHDIDVLVDGGFDNDFVSIETSATGFYVPETADFSDSIGTAKGGFGDDSVLVIQHGESFADTTAMNFQATADGGAGVDVVSAATFVEVDAAMTVSISQSLTGGGGDDEVVACSQLTFDADATGGFGDIVLNATAGIGNDEMILTAGSNSLADTFTLIGITANGGAGNDFIEATAAVEGSGSGAIDIDIIGDSGSDIITATATATATGSEAAVASNAVISNVDAGYGHDFVDVSITGNDLVGTAFGGAGNDEMRIGMIDSGVDGIASISMDGGIGNDTVLGDLGTLSGSSSVYGDFGNDLLSVAGGDANELRGGAGNDTMTGGALADTFVFGTDTLDELADGRLNKDVITNYSFEQGDALQLTDGIAEVASFRVRGGNTELTMVGDHDVIILQNLVINDLSEILFV